MILHLARTTGQKRPTAQAWWLAIEKRLNRFYLIETLSLSELGRCERLYNLFQCLNYAISGGCGSQEGFRSRHKLVLPPSINW